MVPGSQDWLTFTTLLVPVDTSSTTWQEPRCSGRKWSRLAIGRQFNVCCAKKRNVQVVTNSWSLFTLTLHMNSTSSLSISLTTRIFNLARKWRAMSLTASLHQWEKQCDNSHKLQTRERERGRGRGERGEEGREREHLRIDFWMRRTLHPAFLIFLQMSRRYCLSSLRMRSIWV